MFDFGILSLFFGLCTLVWINEYRVDKLKDKNNAKRHGPRPILKFREQKAKAFFIIHKFIYKYMYVYEYINIYINRYIYKFREQSKKPRLFCLLYIYVHIYIYEK
jgi:hypothetical protein